MTDRDPILNQIEMAKRTSIGVDYVLDNAAAEIRALRARVAELEKRLADCIVWMDSREKAQPGMPRLCDMARDALRSAPPTEGDA